MMNVRHGIACTVLFLALGSYADAWQPGYPKDGTRIASRGLLVDAANRDDAVAFWHAVYQASEGYEKRVGWTGAFPSKPGSTSAAFAADVERRINYFRAMCRIPANTRVNSGSLVAIQGSDRFKPSSQTTKAAACQAAVMMIGASYNPSAGTLPGMSHDPEPSLSFWSAAAWNAAAKSNLSFGSYGPGAIREYMVEELRRNSATSEWNSLVGHRRWLLVPDATDFATGDFPGTSATNPSANVLYVIQNKEEVVAPPEAVFVCYPAAGYFPVDLNGRFWSVSRKGADFSSATVRVQDASGATVPLEQVRASSAFGDPALIWQVTGLAASNKTSLDRRYRITVNGIQGTNVPAMLQYDVTFFNPNMLRRTSPVVLRKTSQVGGETKVKLGSRPSFHVHRIAGARASRVIQYQRMTREWVEGGESSKPYVIARSSPVYPFVTGARPISGTKSFNLTFSQKYDLITRNVPEQIMELGPWIQTKSGAKLEFKYMRGLMTDATSFAVEVSTDQGASWRQVGDVIKGYPDARPDVQAVKATYQLPRSKNPQRVRFRYFYAFNGGPLTTFEDMPNLSTGIFLDDIRLVRCNWMNPRKTVTLQSDSFRFVTPKKSKAGEHWAFSLESEFGGPWLPTGPFRKVSLVK